MKGSILKGSKLNEEKVLEFLEAHPDKVGNFLALEVCGNPPVSSPDLYCIGLDCTKDCMGTNTNRYYKTMPSSMGINVEESCVDLQIAIKELAIKHPEKFLDVLL